MARLFLALIAGVAAGYGLAAASQGPPNNLMRATAQSSAPVGDINCVCDVHEMRELEEALQAEREANDVLHTALQQQIAESEELAGTITTDDDRLDELWDEFAPAETDRRQQLLDAGFDASRADWLLERESALRVDALDAAIGPMDELAMRSAARTALREEIGDYEYERYLLATRQSTSVSVMQVLEGSAALEAGFEPGDEILEYDGERVFNVFELTDRARQGSRADPVVVNIERNGAPMQLVVQRGPLGISGGGKQVLDQGN